MITPELAVLAAISGFTIFLGLPVAIIKRVGASLKGFLNAITIGVLIFILIEVLPQAKTYTENAMIISSSSGTGYVVALVAGLGLGIFGLVAYEMRFIKVKQRRNGNLSSKQSSKATSLNLGSAQAAGSVATATSELTPKPMPTQLLGAEEAKQLALTIAIGIGVHNFTEGLAIGQTYLTSATIGISYLLIIGFAIHNSTEGFGIAAPMAGYIPSLKYLAALGLIGGGPTFVGALIGAVWQTNNLMLTFFLALASGALIYIIAGMFYVARRQTSNQLFMLGIFVGFLVAYGTDLFLALRGF
ncbi:MAG: ZIP family metal transporter [archaeon]|nr:ZIP family metal transporter [archaeon]